MLPSSLRRDSFSRLSRRYRHLRRRRCPTTNRQCHPIARPCFRQASSSSVPGAHPELPSPTVPAAVGLPGPERSGY